VLRFFFTVQDMARTRIAPACDPLWETTLSLTLLQNRKGALVFDRWRQRARTQLAATALPRHMLSTLVPPTGYYPDFLTPREGADGLEAGLAALQATPSQQLDTDLSALATRRRLPIWTHALADRDRATLTQLADTLRTYHNAVIAPERERIEAHIEADRHLRAQAMLDGGIDGLLRGLSEGVRWRPPVLEVDYPVARNVHLGGRGLLLVPSYFNWGKPVALKDPELQPVLVYSVATRLALAPPTRQRSDNPLDSLLGRTRALVLQSVEAGATTAELARRAQTSPASASRHAAVLRDAGMLTTQRRGSAVLHTLTPMGADLLKRANR
jgi:DNA-binding transcriptional ArsR family regulator